MDRGDKVKNNIFLLVFVIFILLIFIIPLFLDKVILKMNIISNITVDQSLAFWGNYISAILRSIISILGVILTIGYYMNKDKQEDYKKKFKEEMLMIYYFSFLESINRLREAIIKDEDKEMLKLIWKKCFNIYKYKVIIGKELIEFNNFSIKIEEYINNSVCSIDIKEKYLYEIDKFYKYAKEELIE